MTYLLLQSSPLLFPNSKSKAIESFLSSRNLSTTSIHKQASSTSRELTCVEELSEIVSIFPNCGNIAHAFGYGSGILAQGTKVTTDGVGVHENRMIDLMLAVRDPLEFHTETMRRHPHHYSSVAKYLLGPPGVSWLQSSFGAKVYFNPYVDVPVTSKPRKELARPTVMQMKYGVISREDVIEDLVEWNHLYVAGRMQKPTVLVGDGDIEIMECQMKNIKSALSASLLILSDERSDMSEPDSTSGNGESGIHVKALSEVFSVIASLSYSGDFRMAIGAEDPNKISQLVGSTGQYDRWISLYRQPLEELHSAGVIHVDLPKAEGLTSCGFVAWDPGSAVVRRQLVQFLPRKFSGNRTVENRIVSTGTGDGGKFLAEELSRIVSPAAKYQGLKGLLTAGIRKSIQYSAAKFAKSGILRLKLP